MAEHRLTELRQPSTFVPGSAACSCGWKLAATYHLPLLAWQEHVDEERAREPRRVTITEMFELITKKYGLNLGRPRHPGRLTHFPSHVPSSFGPQTLEAYKAEAARLLRKRDVGGAAFPTFRERGHYADIGRDIRAATLSFAIPAIARVTVHLTPAQLDNKMDRIYGPAWRSEGMGV